MTQVSRDLDRILVGYIGGTQSLGFYDAAYRWARLPLQQILTPLLGVSVAGLTHVRDDADAYRRSLRTLLTPVAAVTFGALMYAALMAELLILVLLGSQWYAAIPLFRWICVGTIAFALLKTTKWIYISMGDSRRQFSWGLISSPLFVAAIAIGAIRGAEGVAIAFAVANWALVWPSMAHCLRGTPVTVRQYFEILTLPASASAIAARAIWPIASRDILKNGLAELALTSFLYAVVFCMAWLVLPRGREAAQELLHLAKGIRTASAQPGDRGVAAGLDGI